MSGATSPAQQQMAQTAQNILSEEKSFQSVQFAITGQREADTLAGIIAVLNTTGLNTHSLRGTQRLFEYLAALYKDSADQSDRVTESWKTQGVFSSGSLGGANTPNPGQYSGLQGQALGNSGLNATSIMPMHQDNLDKLNSSLQQEVDDRKKIQEIKERLAEWQKQSRVPDEIWKIKP